MYHNSQLLLQLHSYYSSAQAAMEAYSISVPTKKGDETTSLSAKTSHLIGGESSQPQPNHQQDDAFSRYSNNFIRMKSLLLLSGEEEDDDEDDDLDALASINRALSSVGLSSLAHLNRDKRRRGNNSACIKQGHERKTRLSWELHPDLLLHDLIEELEALDDGTHRILDNEEDEGEGSSKKEPESRVLEQESQKKE